LHLEEFSSGKVLPHEKTLASAKADRLALQRALWATLSAILGISSAPGFSLADAAAAVVREAPWTDFSDAAGVRHRLWPVADRALHAKLAAELAERTGYIAGGNHPN